MLNEKNKGFVHAAKSPDLKKIYKNIDLSFFNVSLPISMGFVKEFSVNWIG